jgi:hypothetical protein
MALRPYTKADEDALRLEIQQGICQAFAVPPHVMDLKPRPAHLRFRLVRHVDHTAIWLTNHGHDRAAVWLWRAFRLW